MYTSIGVWLVVLVVYAFCNVMRFFVMKWVHTDSSRGFLVDDEVVVEDVVDDGPRALAAPPALLGVDVGAVVGPVVGAAGGGGAGAAPVAGGTVPALGPPSSHSGRRPWRWRGQSDQRPSEKKRRRECRRLPRRPPIRHAMRSWRRRLAMVSQFRKSTSELGGWPIESKSA